MNRERMMKYLKELKRLWISDTQIVRRANASTTTLRNIRNWTISDKKLEQIREAMDRRIDDVHEAHLSAGSSLPLTEEDVDMK